MPSLTILEGDVLDRLPEMAAASVQTCVSSPPYWALRDYKIAPTTWPEITFVPVAGLSSMTIPAQTVCLGLESDPWAFVGHLVHVYRLVHRVLKEDGTIWVNLGDSYAGGGKGGNPPGSPHQKQKTNRGSLLHAGLHEAVRKSGMLDRSWQKPPPFLKQKDLCGIPWRVAQALQADGWYLRCDIIWHKPNPMPESCKDRPTKAHEYLFLLTKSGDYFYDQEAIKEPALYGDRDSSFESERKLTIHPQIGKKCRTTVARGGFNGKTNALEGREAFRSIKDWRNKRTVWSVPSHPFKEAHFATFPPNLIKPCILAGSRVGDVVLDMFFGSGTTGMVGLELGRSVVGIEKKADYVAMARKRCALTPGLPMGVTSA